jgi:ribosomal protein L21E
MTMNLDRQLPNSVDINIAPSSDVKEFQLQGGTGAVGAQDGETFAVPVYCGAGEHRALGR